MYAVFHKSDIRVMVPLSECMIFIYEYQAIFECIKNPSLTYKKIQGGN